MLHRELTHSAAIKVIRANEEYVFKPVFNSTREYTVYRVLTTLFPNHMVFPNMGLQALFQYDRLKPLLSSEEFGYYLKAHVDCCVTSTATYLPVVAFEVDSEYHDTAVQQERDQRKDHIFQVGGVPLVRIRVYGQPTPDALREQIIEALRPLAQTLRETHRTVPGLQPAWELDFDGLASLRGPD